MTLDTVRRAALALAVVAVVCVSIPARETAAESHAAPGTETVVSPDEALARLRAGNEAFRRGLVGTNHLTESYRETLTSSQHPFAIVLSCSDSRVPPEQVFAQGLGDLFVVRVAGNVAEPATVASVEYAAAHLGARLLLVLGHAECGAVKAALESAHDTPAIQELVAAIRPALDPLPKDAKVETAVCANVHRAHEQILKQSELLRGYVRDGKLAVREAYYDLTTGEVRYLETLPR
jgi:carbonic anhydrase